MFKIWGRVNSVNVQKTVWAAAETEVDFERFDAGMAYGKNNEGWYLKINPNGKIPILQDGEFSLWESNVIVRFLCHAHSMGNLCPENPKQRFEAEQWMDWSVSELGPAMVPVFWGLVRTPPDKRNQEMIQAGLDKCFQLYEILDQQLKKTGYVTGNDFTMGDIPVGAIVYRWFNMDIKRPKLHALYGWYEMLKSRPDYQKHVMMPLT